MNGRTVLLFQCRPQPSLVFSGHKAAGSEDSVKRNPSKLCLNYHSCDWLQLLCNSCWKLSLLGRQRWLAKRPSFTGFTDQYCEMLYENSFNLASDSLALVSGTDLESGKAGDDQRGDTKRETETQQM